MGTYEGFTVEAGVEAGGAAEPQVIRAEGDTVTIPDAHLLFSGDFSRSGADLVIAGEGQSVIVADYFGDAGSPVLAAPNGAVMLPHVVSALAGPLAPGQYAQADDGVADDGVADDGEPAQGIGSVVSLTGSATAQRSDGTVVDLAVDSRLAEDDVVQTASGSELGIVFDDGTVFNLNADTRMVLDELVYEPGGSSNSMLFDVVQGVFAFVAGQVAPTGEMRIDTPVATMGVRGTSCLGQIEDVLIFRVIPDPVTNNVGACVLYSRETGLVLAVSDSLDTQLVFDTATGQLVEQPADPAHEDIIERLHDTFVRFAGVPGEQDEDTQQAAESAGSGPPTQISFAPAEVATIVALAGGALAQVEPLASEPVVSGLDVGGEPEGGEFAPAPPPPPPPSQPVSSDPPQQPPGGFTGDDIGSVDEDGTSSTTGQLVFVGGTGLIEPVVIPGTYGTFQIDADGNWVYTLDNDSAAVQGLGGGDSADETFAVVSADGSDTQPVTITVQGVNDVPTVTATTTGTALEDGDGTQVATGTITVDDPDAGESSVQPQSNVAGTYGTFSILANGNWTYTLDNADPAVQGLAEGEMVIDDFTVSSFDGTVTETVIVTVTGANDVPVAQNDAFATSEYAGVDGNVLADNGNGPDDDVDGDPLTVTQVNGSMENVGSPIVLESGALLLLNADGTFNYDPNGQFGDLAPGDSAVDSFTYTVADGQGGSEEATVSITIASVTELVAEDDNVGTTEDTPIAFDVLANDGAPGGPELSVVDVGALSDPELGTLEVLEDGTFLFTPGLNLSGTTSFTYQASDGVNVSEATVTIVVAPVADAPTLAVGQSRAIDGDDLSTWPSLGVVSLVASHEDQMPTDGDPMLLLTTSGATDADIEALLGLSPGALDGVGNDDVTEGSVVTTQLQLVAGDVVSFDWNFGEKDYLPFRDYAFVTIDGVLFKLAEVNDTVNDVEWRGWQTFSFTAQSTGTVTLGVGVVDVGDMGVDSELLIANLRASSGEAEGEPNSPIALPIAASLVDNDGSESLSILIAGVPAGAVLSAGIDNNDGTWTLTAGQLPGLTITPPDSTEDFTLTVTATSTEAGTGDTASTSRTLDIVVQGPNQPPVAVDDTFATDEATVVNGNLLANDSDPDGEPVALIEVNGSAVNFGDPITLASNALLTVNADGSFAYDPNGQFEALGAGTPAEDSFTYTVSDDHGGTDTATVTIEITGVNDAPTVEALADSVSKDAASFAVDLLTDASDIDEGDVLSVEGIDTSITTAGERSLVEGIDYVIDGSTFELTADGFAKFDGLADGASDSFVVDFFVDDGLVSVANTLSVTVHGANNAPVATNLNAAETYIEDTALNLTDIVITDIDSATVTATLTLSNPAAGSLSTATSGTVTSTYDAGSGLWTASGSTADVNALLASVTFTPAADFDGSFSIATSVSDGIAPAVTGTKAITGTGVNDAPTAVNDLAETDEDTVVNIDVLANDSDLDLDELTVTHVNGGMTNLGTQIALASGALLLLNADGSFSYDPNGQFEALGPGESAQDSFTYTIADGQGGSGTATVTLTINGVNEAPIAIDSLIVTNEGVAASGMLTGTDVDPGETLTFELEQGPQNGTAVVNADGSYDYTPSGGFTGQDSFSFRVTDGQLVFDIATVTVDVAAGDEAKNITGTDGNDVLIGSSANDVVSGGLGNDVLRSGGAPQTLFGLDLLDGGPGDDTLVAEGGSIILVGGAGNDELTRVVTNLDYDWARADYRSSPGAITANLTGVAIGGLAPGEVADGFGTVDQISNIHVIIDSAHDDTIHVDSSYSDGNNNFIQVQLSGGNDTVHFDDVAHARIGYNHAGGPVLADLETGTATDLVDGNDFIGTDQFFGKVLVLRGSRFGDELYGSSGDEAFRGEGGDDYIDGRGGNNGIEHHSSLSGVHVDLSQNLVLNDGIFIEALGRYGTDTLIDIHNVTGSDLDDLIIGNAGANQLTGRLGNDTLLGGAGPDELRGGPGDDYLVSGGAVGMFDTINNSYLFFEQDRLEGNQDNDTLIATGGDVMMFGGPGDDTIMSVDDGSYFDFIRVSYRSSPAGIMVGMNGQGGLTVQDGFGGTDTVWRVHVLHDSDHNDTINIDSTYQTSFGNFLEVRLSSGDDTVTFDGIVGRISYRGAGGPVWADLALDMATDLNPGGFIGTDTFFGTVGVLRGSEFGDELYGTEGNEEIRGEGGDDTIDGRGGVDLIRFSGSSSGVQVDLSQETVFDDGLGGVDTVLNIENVDGSDFDDLIIGDINANRLRGALGDDVIHGGAGNDEIVGDFGLPVEAIAAGASSNDILHGEEGDDSLFGGAGQDELRGGAGNDYLESGGATGGFDKHNNVYSFIEQDLLIGGAGNDTLVATGGEVVMVGGAGDDMISSEDNAESWFDFTIVRYGSSPAGITVTMDGSNLTVEDGFGGTDTVSRVHVLYDSEFGDTITVDSNYQTSYGNFIEVRLSAGNDTVNFLGVELARIGYQGAGGPVLIDLEDGMATDLIAGNNFIGIDQFNGTVHVARGTRFDDELYGSSGDEAFRAGVGDDLIDGRGGIDAIQYIGAETGVHVDLSQNLVLNDGHWIDAQGGYGTDAVLNIENVVGSPFDDLIIGDSLANRLDGGLGADQLFGGDGNDVLVSGGATGAIGNHGYEFYEQDYLEGGAGDDTLVATRGDVIMVGGSGNDIIRSEDDGTGPSDFSRVSYRASTSGIVAMMAGTSLSVQDGLGGTDTVSRVHVVNDSEHNDSITVDANYQTSFGAFLEVRLSSGNDTVEFIGFAGRIAYVGAGGGVQVDLEARTATDVNPGDTFIGNDSFTGQVALLRGSNFNDVLLGSSGNDSFRGHGGDDFIDGRGGTNTVHFGGSNFGVHVDLSQNMAFADGHWYAAEGRYGMDELANIHNVRGSEFADLIIGDDGVNDIRGGTGGDILLGGLGDDTLEGGPGADRFVYRSPDDGGDRIIDFAVSEDVLVIDAAAFGGGLVGGRGLNGSQFVWADAPIAIGNDGRFIYDTSNGDLWWDGDGTGAQTAVHIATLDGIPDLTAGDFQIVPSAAGFVAVNDVVAALEAGEAVA